MNDTIGENRIPESFEDLAASRRHWIDTVLAPWCRLASQKQLRQAEPEWLDIAGRVDTNATLWTWAWERFPVLTYPDMAGVNETQEVEVTLKDGTVIQGYPDSRQSVRGNLILLGRNSETGKTSQLGPYSIDDIRGVSLVSQSDR